MFGLNEIQIVEVILLILISGIVFGSIFGLLTRGLNSIFK